LRARDERPVERSAIEPSKLLQGDESWPWHSRRQGANGS
jgi:hypothetical protein